jgi:hypothetical protein
MTSVATLDFDLPELNVVTSQVVENLTVVLHAFLGAFHFILI